MTRESKLYSAQIQAQCQSAVGSEELIGAVILDNKEKYLMLREEAYTNEETYKSLAAQYW